jgi:hypothetical protein
VAKVLSLGDCNAIGFGELKGFGYAERVANSIGMECLNKGHTMCTSREGVKYFLDYYSSDVCLLIVNYGLVDSWRTVSGFPYVLYYPDNFFRKLCRKALKKAKKIVRKCFLLKFFGLSSVVSLEEYRNNILFMVGELSSETKLVLIEIPYNMDESRNGEILSYNKTLREISSRYENVIFVETFRFFEKAKYSYLLADGTHISDAGYEFITKSILHSLDCKR